jgi:hypothetical protein
MRRIVDTKKFDKGKVTKSYIFKLASTLVSVILL